MIDGPARPFFKAVFLFYSLMNRIIRVKAEKGFTIVPNTVFNSGLSLRAIGLLTYILHLPDDWVLYKSYLYDNMPLDGRDAIKTAWNQLEEKGFIVIEKKGGGKGKLPEINYIVYDSPHKMGVNQSTETRRSETRPPETRRSESRRSGTRPLLKTNVQSTNEQNTITVIPEGITGPTPEDLPPEQTKKKKEAKQPAGDSDPKAQTIFQLFTSSYDAFFRKLNGVPPQYGKASGSATNSLVAYFRKIAKDRATKDAQKTGGNDPGESYIDGKAHEGWEYVLENWARLDGFLQTKTRLIDINSNIQNIITQLKNGHSKKQTGNSGPTGGNVSTASLAHTIAAVYGGANQ